MTEIARALEMPKSSAHALVTTLAEVGLLSVGPDGLYGLGWNLFSLSERMRAGLEFRQHALPFMQDLAEELGETVLLAVLDGGDVIYVERVDGTHPMVRLAGAQIGTRVPAYCTGVGRALLAHREPLEVRALFASTSLEQRTSRTLATIEELEDALVQTRTQGVAYDFAEAVEDIACVGAPVSDAHGAVIAAVSVAVPAYRFPVPKDRGPLVRGLKLAAQRTTDSIKAAAETPPWHHGAPGRPT